MKSSQILCLMVASFVAVSFGAARAADDGDAAIIAPIEADLVRSRILDWAASEGLSDKAKIESVGKLWVFTEETPSPEDIHARAVETFKIVSPEAQKLITACQYGTLSPPDASLLSNGDLDPFFVANLRAHLARFLGQSEFYDEALEQFDQIELSQVIDPASVLFFKAVCQHRLLMKTEGLKTIGQLLNDTTGVPVRFRTVAELMQADLAALKEKTLNEVARMMSDVERRLRFGRGGERVQKVEEEIVARLDEIIKKIEAQQGGGGGGGGDGQGNSNSSGGPASDSRVKGSTAPGEVDERDIGRKSGWGSLPPKEQAKARNLIDRELPPHYRAAIEEYLRKLAKRPATRK
jgi:hypothetical protein